MTTLRPLLALCLSLFLLWQSSGIASAHARLTQASIRSSQVFKVGHTPTTLRAYFAELLDPKRSWINVFEGRGDHGLVNEKTRSHVVVSNPKEMVLQLPRLAPGPYYFMWYTRSAVDSHYAGGVVFFRVVK